MLAEVDEPGARDKTKSSPLPVTVTVCGLPSALSVMATFPALGPLAVGLKATWTVQLALIGTSEPQLLVWEESPLASMLAMLRVSFPVLVRVTNFAELVVPTVWMEKAKELGE